MKLVQNHICASMHLTTGCLDSMKSITTALGLRCLTILLNSITELLPSFYITFLDSVSIFIIHFEDEISAGTQIQFTPPLYLFVLSLLHVCAHTRTQIHTHAGPNDLYSSPVTTQQEYGWWSSQDDCKPQPWTHTKKHPLVNSEMTRCVVCCIHVHQSHVKGSVFGWFNPRSHMHAPV